MNRNNTGKMIAKFFLVVYGIALAVNSIRFLIQGEFSNFLVSIVLAAICLYPVFIHKRIFKNKNPGNLSNITTLQIQALESYIEDEINEYQYLATLDNCTCEKCGELDGKVFKVSDAKAGTNFPPIHNGCRCTTVAYFDYEDLSQHERLAKDTNRKYHNVPAAMNYIAYKKIFIDKNMTLDEWKVIRNIQ